MYLKRRSMPFSQFNCSEPPTSTENPSAAGFTQVLIYFGNEGCGMLVLPGEHAPDLEKVGRLLALEQIRLATDSEMLAMFPDCELGAIPPFGNLFGLPVLLDQTTANAEDMIFRVGSRRDAIRMSVADYRSLTNPRLAPIAREGGASFFVNSAKARPRS